MQVIGQGRFNKSSLRRCAFKA